MTIRNRVGPGPEAALFVSSACDPKRAFECTRKADQVADRNHSEKARMALARGWPALRITWKL